VNVPRDNYKVGYKRPPAQTRWKKGQSGNPRRRKLKAFEGTVATIDRLLLTPVQISLSGERTKVSALEAIMCQLLQKAISGNLRAFRVLLKYQEFAIWHGDKKLELTFVDSAYTRDPALEQRRCVTMKLALESHQKNRGSSLAFPVTPKVDQSARQQRWLRSSAAS
jgi:hypothetical protein